MGSVLHCFVNDILYTQPAYEIPYYIGLVISISILQKNDVTFLIKIQDTPDDMILLHFLYYSNELSFNIKMFKCIKFGHKI